LTPDEAMRRFPPFILRGDETVYFEPGAGLLLPERCLEAQIGLARRYGARLRTGETVTAVEAGDRGATVVTDKGVYGAGQVVVAAGPWAPALLGDGVGRQSLAVYRQLMHWFEPDDPAPFGLERFPVFIWMHGAAAADWFYGFPLLPGESTIKIADERFDEPLSGPEAQTQSVDPAAPARMWRDHIAGRIAGVGDRCRASAACLYTMAPESRFLIGRDPARERLILVSACSGHGFKHSAAIGDLVAELAAGASTPALLEPFALGLG
jgi:sarcosine oxidase